ncbi:hypothetical protein [Mesorhizobium sp. 131-2-1]|uniref:hypothetical protein n=1 Tax=Mesorhizobium sp. 131-2-1 TaxID=2744518 RepID=UPI001927B0A1|nr:hypothetical protein [Mesorhizobium sp. 131-2-1]BCG94166.1 hypothetical protein MesoLj131a_30300 [Mesorhizobium sp. 131-2-1]
MADSDNTMTLPFVTRRKVIAGMTIAIAGWEMRTLASDAAAVPFDPALAVWLEWREAREVSQRLCDKSAQLERTLVETVGFPCATVRLPGGEDVTLHSIRALHEALGAGADTAEELATAEAHFAAHQARWDAADRRVGFSGVAGAEMKAGERAEALLEALAATPATSLTGVAAKLNAVLLESEVREGGAEFPWPQIRSAFQDIMRIGRQRETPGTPSDAPSRAGRPK